jgi:RHS repeat-associated protein
LLTFNSETRQYNNLNQMTRLTITGALDISYNFPAGTNNGKISTQTDNISGETVTYQYDSLNRLLSATSNQSWSETYGFDGFGNLLSKTGTGGAPTLSQTVDPATNHIVGQGYDSNGNQASGPLGSVAYDAENRIASVPSAGIQYAYDSKNKRIWSSTLSGGNLTQTFYYYGTDGQKLGIYPMNLQFQQNGTTPVMTDNTNVKLSTFFGSKRIGAYDRLGTAKYNANGQPQSFYPYGEDRGTVQPNDSLKFATYTRDSATGLDYADQRHYASNFGRFMSPDPYKGSARVSNPTSWNRYTYAGSDPANLNDRTGLEDEETYCDVYADDPYCSGFYVCPNGSVILTGGDCSDGQDKRPPKGVSKTQWLKDKAAAIKLAQDLEAKALDLAKKAIANPDCAALFGTSTNGLTAADVLGGTAKGVSWNINFTYDTSPKAAIATTRPGFNLLTYLSGNRSFVTTIDTASSIQYWDYGDEVENADTLLHELGHVLRFLGFQGGDFVQDDRNDQVNQKNSQDIMDTCLKGLQ